ncbi:hypothetical protein Q3G72_004666 [Acer saccharum]|nr:hypothetical protein Q3G72_004666 [Acer saccharum]
MVPSGGEYIMEISIGTPKIKVPGNVDTGSDLAWIQCHNVVSTPLVDKEPKTFYYVTLEVISVGKKRLAYISSSSNISQKEALEEAIGWFKRVRNLWGLPSVCFKVRSHHSGHLPIITVHFTGADVKLPTVSSYFRVQKHMVCLTMIASYDISILGNLSQMNLYAGYDLEKKKVFFKPADCTKHSKNA